VSDILSSCYRVRLDKTKQGLFCIWQLLVFRRRTDGRPQPVRKRRRSRRRQEAKMKTSPPFPLSLSLSLSLSISLSLSLYISLSLSLSFSLSLSLSLSLSSCSQHVAQLPLTSSVAIIFRFRTTGIFREFALSTNKAIFCFPSQSRSNLSS
jgi:hypothetical protein